MAKATGSEVLSVERPIGTRMVLATLGSSTSKPWLFAVIDQGVRKSGVLEALYGMTENTKRTVVCASRDDCFYPLMGTTKPYPDILRAIFGRFRGLVVDGVLMLRGPDPKPWENVDWDDPHLNPIVSAITDGRIPPPEEADPVESFAKLIEGAPKVKLRKRSFMRAAERACPSYHEKVLW